MSGAAIAVGAGAVLDNLVVHWWLRWHRAAPQPWAEPVEAAQVVVGLALLAWGIAREVRAARRARRAAR